MTTSSPMLFALYRRLLALYPQHLRMHYRDQMLQTLRDAHAEARHPLLFWLYAYADLLESILQENLFMLRDQLSSRPIFFHAVILGIILTGMGGAASLVFQQMLRRGADQPQIQMVQQYASTLASGKRLDEILPVAQQVLAKRSQTWTQIVVPTSPEPPSPVVDIQTSLQPFLISYDDGGMPLSATGQLNQIIPVLPHGVFDYVRSHGQERVTWQPQPGIRIASVIQRVDGAHPGFLLAGRSLRIVEEQEDLFWKIVFGAWIALVILLMAGAALLTRAQTTPTSSAARA